MKKSTHPHKIHLGDPRVTPYIDHRLEVIKTHSRNIHPYEMRCTTCNKHVKWATELEYLWYKNRGVAKFRTLWWAPTYDTDYQQLQHELYLERQEQRLYKPEELGI